MSRQRVESWDNSWVVKAKHSTMHNKNKKEFEIYHRSIEMELFVWIHNIKRKDLVKLQDQQLNNLCAGGKCWS